MISSSIETDPPARRARAAPLGVNRPSWYEDARCAGKSRYFFPPPRETILQRVAREAKAAAICAACPSAEACRAFAREHHEIGFWGGENDERRIAAGHRAVATDPAAVRRARSL
jgi:WhiB family redox-sensing transcriptional regulator